MRFPIRCFCFLLWLVLAAASAQAQTPAKPTPAAARKPFVLGVIDSLRSHRLGETRTLNIYLPDGFQAADTTTYPVIYLLDGSADEDFIHVVGLVQFNTFPWIKRIPKSIVVGIANVDRRRDFTFPTTIAADRRQFPTTGQSAAFIDFIEQELQPFMARHYRAGAGRTLIGQSLGGLLATEILLSRPTLFDRYVIISPSLWWNDGSLLTQPSPLFRADFRQPTAVYIGVGKEGLTPGTTPRVMEVDANRLADRLRGSASKHLVCHFDYLPQEDHATITHQAVFNALRLLYPIPAR
ncbi:alpha/beta hydrolase [Spirosoma luteolum]